MSYKKRSNEDDLPKAIKNMKKQRLREEIEVDKNKKARHGKRKNNKNFNKKKKIKKIVLITILIIALISIIIFAKCIFRRI